MNGRGSLSIFKIDPKLSVPLSSNDRKYSEEDLIQEKLENKLRIQKKLE